MDNAYFIGYRIDIDHEDFDMWDMSKDFKDEYGVSEFPGEEWMAYTKVDGGTSLLWMKGAGADYRCPIDREELWKDLHSRTFDFPWDGMAVIESLWGEKIHKYLSKKYGSQHVQVRWGIFLCLG